MWGSPIQLHICFTVVAWANKKKKWFLWTTFWKYFSKVFTKVWRCDKNHRRVKSPNASSRDRLEDFWQHSTPFPSSLNSLAAEFKVKSSKTWCQWPSSGQKFMKHTAASLMKQKQLQCFVLSSGWTKVHTLDSMESYWLLGSAPRESNRPSFPFMSDGSSHFSLEVRHRIRAFSIFAP